MTIDHNDPESVLDAPYTEDEVYCVTLDYEEWKREVLPTMTGDSSGFEPVGYGMDAPPNLDDIASRFKGFLTAPIGKYNKDMLMARQYTSEFLDVLVDNHDFSNSFLYMIGGRFVDITSFDPDVPATTRYIYTIRYADLGPSDEPR